MILLLLLVASPCWGARINNYPTESTTTYSTTIYSTTDTTTTETTTTTSTTSTTTTPTTPTTTAYPIPPSPRYEETRKPEYKAPVGGWPYMTARPYVAQGPPPTVPNDRSYRPSCPPPVCPPCPCAYPQQRMVFQPKQNPFPYQMYNPMQAKAVLMDKETNDDNDDDDDNDDHAGGRHARSTSDDYWHNTGSPNAALWNLNLGYAAQYQIRDQLNKYGPALHLGYIDGQDDFNYPGDLHAFNQPGFAAENIDSNIVYMLKGPIVVTPDPSNQLVGPINVPQASFTKIVLSSGLYRLLVAQKNGLLKIQTTDTHVNFIVDCNHQPYGSCDTNLEPVKNPWDFPMFRPMKGQIYTLVGDLKVGVVGNPIGPIPVNVVTADAFTQLVLSSGNYKITKVFSFNNFRMVNIASTTPVYEVDCLSQVNPASCFNLKLNSP